MTKKDFKSSAKKSVASAFFGEAAANTPEVEEEKTKKGTQDALDTLNTLGTQNTQSVQNARDTSRVPLEEQPPYRINLKLKGEYKEYLDQVSWENRTSITQYLNDLIEADRKRYFEQNKNT